MMMKEAALVAAEEAHLGCLADCGLHKHNSYISTYDVEEKFRNTNKLN
jgi:hypothetical protein